MAFGSGLLRALAVALGQNGDALAAELDAAVDAAAAVAAGEITLADGAVLIGGADGLAAAKVPSGDVTIDRDGVTAIGLLKVTQAMMAVGAAGAGITGLVVKFLANVGVIGAIPVVHQINIADASADTDLVLTHKTLILDAWIHNTGIAAHAANDTVQLKNGATAITDALAKTDTVEAIRRFGVFVAAQKTIAAGGTLRVTAVKDTNVACTVFVLGARVA